MATLGIAGAGGIGGGAIAGMDGREAAGNVGGEFGEPSLCAPAGPPGRLREITCVYGLGPLGGAGWLGTTSLTGRLKACVAPSEGETDDGTTGCISIAGFGSGGAVKIGGVGSGTIGGVGVTCDAGCGGTNGSGGGEAKAAESSVTGGCNPPEGGAPAVPDVRDTILGLLNHPVNPEPAGSLPATPAAGEGSSASGELNIAVNSPTLFRGGSICCGDVAGTSDGPSTRNGP